VSERFESSELVLEWEFFERSE